MTELFCKILFGENTSMKNDSKQASDNKAYLTHITNIADFLFFFSFNTIFISVHVDDHDNELVLYI